MIFIFGFLLLLFLLILIFLSYQGKINYNVPIIFLFFIMTMSPFLYLAKTKNKIENYSNWNQTMNSSLDIYYTNTNKNKKATNGCNECPGVCDAESQEYGNTLKPVASDINNPVQLKSSTKNLSEIQLTLNSSLNQFSAYISVPKKNKSFSFFANNNALQFIQLQANELLKFADNPSSNILTSNASSIQINSPNSTTMLINSLNRVPNNSYIILATVGYNLSGILDAPQNNLADLSQIYQLTNLNQIINGSLYTAVLYKSIGSYTQIKEYLTSPQYPYLYIPTFNLVNQGISLVSEQTGTTFEEIPESNARPQFPTFAEATYNIISPFSSKSKTFLTFSAENNHSFIFLSPRTEANKFVQYDQSPQTSKGPQINTVLNTRQPEFWNIEPVYITNFNNMFYIKTFEQPYYYLEVNTSTNPPKLKMNLFKGGEGQYWYITKTPDNNYTIQNVKTKLYLSYSNVGGYLYEDTGEVNLTDSFTFKWNIQPSNAKKSLHILDVSPNFQEFISPNDFGNTKNPVFQLSGKINNKDISISSNGRTVWNELFSSLWNGQWIYYGTAASFINNKPRDQTVFLEISIDKNGVGTLTDPWFGFTASLVNAGASILIGKVLNGDYSGSIVFLQFKDFNLDNYQGPRKSFPVKMNYYLLKSLTEYYNLGFFGKQSSAAGYCVKFDGKILALANFLEANGIPVDQSITYNANLKATFFDHCGFVGPHQLGPGRYTTSEFTKIVPNKGVSSVKVPQGLRVTMFEGDLTGRKVVLGPGDWDCGSNVPDVGNLYNYFNDRASSAIIEEI